MSVWKIISLLESLAVTKCLYNLCNLPMLSMNNILFNTRCYGWNKKFTSYVNITIFDSIEPALDRQAIASGHEANNNQESLKLSSSTNGPLPGVFVQWSVKPLLIQNKVTNLVLGVQHINGPHTTDAASSYCWYMQINQCSK